ncbi:FadR/GntR family transcriptional regulator [Motiliproteus sp. SC1-56]|uniref:FadR/GntR family transcriptional regulator n=1 Tax=Motiliproteus sp. SC1-56 TaxID=2799565 RepID=UPI001A8FD2E7|nr:FadR/GntR family transcriptional regulator [Motiliproteus sp. SC1-56]
MAIDYQPLQAQSLAKQIADQLREAILDGRLKVDERLPTEEELASRFDVSRPTIREALKRLAAQNLVRSRRGPAGGTFIKHPSADELKAALSNAATLMVTLGEFDLAAVTEARRAMEKLCLGLAVKRRTEEDIARMQAQLERQQEPITDEAFCASDVAFHRALVDASANPVLQFNMVTVIEALQPLMNMIANRTRERQVIVDHHRELLQALEARDLARGEAALDALLDYLGGQFRTAQERNGEAHR